MHKNAQTFLVVACILSIYVLGEGRYRFDSLYREGTDYHLVEISPSYLGMISLGHESLMADCLWLDLVFRLGESIKNQTETSYVTTYVDAITTLSPSFEGVYELAGTLVPQLSSDFNYTNAILEKGVNHVSKKNDRYWYVLFYLGINAYFGQNDAYSAARYIEAASKYPNSPGYFPVFAASLYAQSDNEYAGLAVVERFLKEFDDPYVLSRLREKQLSLKKEIETSCNEDVLRYILKPKNLELFESIGIIKSVGKNKTVGSHPVIYSGDK
ncbi:hypothetical protein [Desulfoluna spongiiphila]|uniref:hypothetical protein n=1 Tax=Desulfoluna spongiiphila TaxID=419481 RepID=UPI00125152DB|nr:hypothetical protein [Desulfoluna spongiiphila]VVS90849.1 hypothetical protein DBB_4170 [Desulfoluna spongiiphila]